VTEAVNPDVEITRKLTEQGKFPRIASLAGWLEYRTPRRPPVNVGILQNFVPNEGDAWRYTLDQLGQYFERSLARAAEVSALPVPEGTLLDLAREHRPDLAEETIGAYLETARLLGCRTAELHLALASIVDDPEFAPESFTTLYQRSLYQSMRNLTHRAFRPLRERLRSLPEDTWEEAVVVMEAEDEVLATFGQLTRKKLSGQRIRCHGDYHLGQVLRTGRDFVIIDFEGEPARSPSERRMKRSPLSDVAGMLRSFDYAAHATLFGGEAAQVRVEDRAVLEPWARFWVSWTSASFLAGYLEAAHGAAFLPETSEELKIVFQALILEKSVYELGYELDNRPDWVKIPLRGIRRYLERK
jgi:maltose alpha-D-glucosyltransferase/alpha-amylase